MDGGIGPLHEGLSSVSETGGVVTVANGLEETLLPPPFGGPPPSKREAGIAALRRAEVCAPYGVAARLYVRYNKKRTADAVRFLF